ncbi:Uncharacterized protein dnm_012160 [Desulfonema magnum]|uniref:Uncharacterized protein n=1 Tax=Desulfonema magnum TaxID=45655 RepID=A0A975GKX0_9BACT|nr:Uncharacterized protein dnm_012160 [Desulfonema magnum]
MKRPCGFRSFRKKLKYETRTELEDKETRGISPSAEASARNRTVYWEI